MRWKILLILLVLMVVYVFVGGAIFYGFERYQEEEYKVDVRKYSQQFLQNHQCISEDEFKIMISNILRYYEAGVVGQNGTKQDSNWDYASATFFATTVITTIGYGHITPQTSGGQSFCIAYAVIGIPLMLTLLAGIGEKINLLAMKIDKRLTFCESRPTLAKIVRTTLTIVIGLTVFIMIPAIGFTLIDEWSYGTSIYYGVITLTTIGFGDYVASANNETVEMRAFYRFLVCIWILFGLSWVAGIIATMQSLMHAGIEKGVEKGGEKLGLASNDQLQKNTTEDSSLSIEKPAEQPNNGSTSKVAPISYGGTGDK